MHLRSASKPLHFFNLFGTVSGLRAMASFLTDSHAFQSAYIGRAGLGRAISFPPPMTYLSVSFLTLVVASPSRLTCFGLVPFLRPSFVGCGCCNVV
jgi:hypothetical protein